MRRFSAVLARALLALATPALAAGLALTGSQVIAGSLYQWTGKDGTPTYSPDPPPDGVNYEIVGADLKPLQTHAGSSQADAEPAPATTTLSQPISPIAKSTADTQAQQKQVPSKPVVPWKPVKYADDPKTQAPPRVAAAAVNKNTTKPTIAQNDSPACTLAKQQRAMLESEFAKATTDENMDRAILKLRDQKQIYQSACKLR